MYLILSFFVLFPIIHSAGADSGQFFPGDFGLKPYDQIETQILIEQLTKQISAEPLRAELYYYLAQAYASQGWKDKASQYLSQWIKLSNSDVVVKDNHAFFIDEKNDKVLVFDTNTKQVIRKIDVPWLPRKMVLPPNEAKIYVTSSLANSVSIIDTEDLTVENNIKTGTMPWDAKPSKKGDRVYVANLKSDDVSVIDTSTNTMLGNLSAGKGPWSIALSSDGHKLYVSNQDSRDLRVIDTGNYSVVDILSIGANPRDIALAPDDKTKLYLTDADISNNELEIYVVDLKDLGIADTMSVPATDEPLLVKFQKMSLMDKINMVCKTKPNGKDIKQLPTTKTENTGRLVFGNQPIGSKIRNSIVSKTTNLKPIRNTFNSSIPSTSTAKRNVLRIAVVVQHDTLWKISVDNYGVATAAIYKAIQNINPEIDDINIIYAGQKIKLPDMNQPSVAISESQNGAKSVIVKPKENLFRIILANYGVATEEIYTEVLKANPHIESRDIVKVGQRILLPDIPNSVPDSNPSNNYERVASY